MMKPSECGEKKASRQCWECLKRRLVCDHTLPGCKKCQKAGKECPGYDEQKPLQWIQPGKVTSRRRKKDNPPKVYTVPVRKHTEIDTQGSKEPETLSTVPPPLSDPIFDRVQDQSFYSAWKSSKEDEWGHLAEDYEEKVSREIAIKAASLCGILDQVYNVGGRSRIAYIVANGLHDEAALMLPLECHAMKRLERILHLLDLYDVPDYTCLNNETSDVVQAVQYYNDRIQPMIQLSGALAPNPAIIKFPINVLYALPPAVHHTLVCLSLNHFIHSLPIGANRTAVAAQRSKIFSHRGNAIRALSAYVGKDKTRCSDLAISSILMFMSMELQNPPMADWRSHASGLNQLIGLRGGTKKLRKEAPYLAPTIAVFIIILTTANTCSPAWDQLNLCGDPEQNFKDIEEIYNLLFPYTLCPPALFFDIMRISQLRQKASIVLFSGDMESSHALEAHDLLNHIEAFRPEDWAQPNEYYEDWLLIGTIYQSAIAIYCTMAFQSLTLFAGTLEMNSMRSIHGDRLLAGLGQGVKSSHLKNFMMWPLQVAGVEAGYRDGETRYWIGTQMENLSRHLGTSGPLKCLAVLKRYWRKQEPGWDECFDKPYACVI
ncbi:hypothetical protein BDU57DRAFT_586971 [Ampelomyces quisqualis]|uniref:Zn(2)-C6 fungal-type domain-containing protein n=1 Tax=Ampelomyces quisqualis TaxID=50730 RepID=A0A6A5QM45_AMPQU|nr:hypothetical protein BDU57DRAFT_586971 [Ampelomyces quisqualis]